MERVKDSYPDCPLLKTVSRAWVTYHPEFKVASLPQLHPTTIIILAISGIKTRQQKQLILSDNGDFRI